MSMTFYVIMQKRKDGQVYADLHKTDGRFFLTEEDARRTWENDPRSPEHFHIVELIAMSVDDWDQLLRPGDNHDQT